MLKYNQLTPSSNVISSSSNTSLFVWGSNSNGELGDGSTTNKSRPVVISNFLGGKSFASIATGFSHTVALDSTGGLWTWGDNTYGQLGDGTTVDSSVPIKIGSSSWSAVGTAGNTSIAVTTTGLLYGWGNNTDYTVGDGTTTHRSSPVQITAKRFSIDAGSWASVSIAPYHTLAINAIDGSLWAWGYNGYGQLGDGTFVNKSSPVKIGTSSWKAVSAGHLTSYGITTDGRLWSWGYNGMSGGTVLGALGLNDFSNSYRSLPTQIGTSSWNAVAAGPTHCVAITTSGALFGWGYNNFGQVGDWTNANRYTPTAAASTSSFTIVAANRAHAPGNFYPFSAAITIDGKLFTWGYNGTGQLGYNNTNNSYSPVQVGSSSWSAVSTGSDHTLAITTTGALFAWGFNGSGQLGDGTAVNKSSPVQIGTSSWTKIGAGNAHSAAIRTDGGLFTWGNNNAGWTLGDGSLLNRSSPVQIGTSSWSFISAAFYNTMATASNGNLYGWGYNNYGQLGIGTTVDVSFPTATISQYADTDETSFAPILSQGLGNFAYAVGSSQGHLYAWGQNGQGQLPNSTPYSSTRSPISFIDPKIFVTPESWKMISVGYHHVLAIRSTDSSLWAWGNNTYGQLGDYTTVNKSSPVKIGTSSWITVSAGGNHSLGITTNNLFWSWGLNDVGQLGDGTNNKSSPVLVSARNTTPFSWKIVSTGAYYTVAIRSTDGSLWAWGSNGSGQLGDGTTVSKSSPVQIGTSSWNTVSAGVSHTAAITIDGKLFLWGYGFYAQLGDGGFASRSSPVQLGTSSWSVVSCGLRHTMGITIDGGLWAWGTNTYSQLGNAALNTTVTTPLKVGNLSWAKVSAGAYHTLGILSTGALYSWGTNTYGQLGDSTTVTKSSPVLVLVGGVSTSSWSAVSAGLSHSAGILINGALYTWGYNYYGQLGDGTTVNKSSPVKIGTSSWITVSASGGITTSAIRLGNSLFTWGYSGEGNLGDGTTVGKSSPVLIGSGPISWTSLGTGNGGGAAQHLAGIGTDNKVYTWGYNGSGAIGDLSTSNRYYPRVLIDTSIPTTNSWNTISAGYNSSAGINSLGELFMFGYNANGNLGDGTTITRRVGQKIGSSSWTIVSVGKAYPASADFCAAAIRTDGGLFTWGYNSQGQLGDGTQVNKSSPVKIGSSSWSFLSAGGLVMAAIRTDGGLFTWGYNIYGQLGDGTTIGKSSPVQIGTSSWSFVDVGCGYYTTFGIKTNGTLWAWGANFSTTGVSGFGNGTTTNTSSPIQIGTIGTSSWSAVSSTDYTTSILTSDKKIYLWGVNSNYELGDKTTAYKRLPVFSGVTFNNDSRNITSIKTTNSGAALILDNNNNLSAVGNNTNYELGIPTIVTNSINVIYRSSGSIKNFDVGGKHAAAISINNFLFQWGATDASQIPDYYLGLNGISKGSAISNITYVDTSSVVSMNSDSWYAISSKDGWHTLAIKASDRSLWAWGNNASGQLGDNTTVNKSSPVQIGTSSWNAVSTTWYNSAGITSDGRLFTWGSNAQGQLGDGTTIGKSSPVQIGTSSWSMVSMGNWNGAAIRTDGALFTWGNNSSSQLGDNGASRSSPVQIGTSSWNMVSVGISHTAGITIDGGLWTWGYGFYGQLGLNSQTTWGTPQKVTIPATYSWSVVSCGYYHTAAIRTDGILWTWGYNGNYQLGDNTSSIRYYPVQIGSSSWTAVSATELKTFGLLTNGALYAWGTSNSYDMGLTNYVTSTASPIKVAGTNSWTKVSAGRSFASGIDLSGKVYVWGGDGGNGSLGANGLTFTRYFPTQIYESSTSYNTSPQLVSLGYDHTTLISSDSANNTSVLYSWGDNSRGQFGNNNTTGSGNISPTLSYKYLSTLNYGGYFALKQ